MHARRHAPESECPRIDLAPMLDFTINLLIFFIITTSFIKETGITVFRPAAVTAEFRESGNLLIAIRENGDIWMDRQQVERPDDSVVIIADRAAGAGMLARVMDEVRAGGITQVAIAADPNADGG